MITLTRARAQEALDRLGGGDTVRVVCREMKMSRTTITRIRRNQVRRWADDLPRVLEVVLLDRKRPCDACGKPVQFMTPDGECLKCVAEAMSHG